MSGDDSESGSDPGTWVDVHGNAMYRYALLHVRDPQVAEDLVQEAFVAALRARRRFRGESSERTWLVSILRHKMFDRFRRRGRESVAADPERFDALADTPDNLFNEQGRWQAALVAWPTDPHEALENREFLDALEACLEHLTERLRTVFLMREIDGLSTEEICKELDVTATNVGVIIYRARMKLRSCLEQRWFIAGRV